MQIAHIGVWTSRLEEMKTFYATYFNATSGPKYTNVRTAFESYFLSFPSGARLELMTVPGLEPARDTGAARAVGWAHLALALGSEEAVDALTARLQCDGYPVLDGPRRTGDGYYESTISDPDGNRLELTV
jgi:lactoylglutathione lyase